MLSCSLFAFAQWCVRFLQPFGIDDFFVLMPGSDWPLYIGLAVVGAICIALGAGLARGARKRSLPPYSIARTGKYDDVVVHAVYGPLLCVVRYALCPYAWCIRNEVDPFHFDYAQQQQQPSVWYIFGISYDHGAQFIWPGHALFFEYICPFRPKSQFGRTINPQNGIAIPHN